MRHMLRKSENAQALTSGVAERPEGAQTGRVSGNYNLAPTVELTP